MQTIQIGLNNPQAINLLRELDALQLITIMPTTESSVLQVSVEEYQQRTGLKLDKDDYDLVTGQLECGVEEPLLMQDIVAAVKEVRAERNAARR